MERVGTATGAVTTRSPSHPDPCRSTSTITTAADISNNNLFGNGVGVAMPNCGLDNLSGGIVTSFKDFWRLASGPGAEPADTTCSSLPGGTTVVNAPASKAYPVKASAGQ